MKNIGLIFFSIFVDLALSISGKNLITVDSVRNVVQNNLVLVFTSAESRNLHTLERFLSNILSLLDVTDIEENSRISEWLLIVFPRGMVILLTSTQFPKRGLMIL